MVSTGSPQTPQTDDVPTSVAPPARNRVLTPHEMGVEATRLAVGFAALVGSGFVRLLEGYGIPEDDLFDTPEAENRRAAEDDARAPSAGDAISVAVASMLGLLSAPEGPAPKRRSFAGFLFDAPAVVSSVRGNVREATAPVRRIAAMVSSLGPAKARIDAAQATLDRWHRIGNSEIEASRQYAAAVIDGGARLGMDWIVDNLNLNLIIKNLDLNRIINNLELTDVIVESTGGVTERTLESVRSQAVGADGLVERIVSRILRREIDALPDGPGLLVEPVEVQTAGTDTGDSAGTNGAEPKT
jgi:hypothetical protein